jgi:DNA repair protein RadC
MTSDHTNHRQRLREGFIEQKPEALTDERILELLLTYGIPQKDVYPLAKELISTFGNLNNVLSADKNTLTQYKGLKDYSAVLLKLVDWILKTHSESIVKSGEQEGIYNPGSDGSNKSSNKQEKATTARGKKRKGTGLFGKAMLGEAIKILPGLPDTESLKEIHEYIKSNLPFNSEQTRSRNTAFIISRMFPLGTADRALRMFSRYSADTQALKDVCYYRFCKVEPLMVRLTENLLIPGIATGSIKRNFLKEYLGNEYPESKSIPDCAQAIVEAIRAGGIARCTKDTIYLNFRMINTAALAFILHSEYPEPGMYDIGLLERNQAIKTMLWRPDQLLPALFELRNQGILSKVSEIDNVRQFTTQYSLDEVVAALTPGEVKK